MKKLLLKEPLFKKTVENLKHQTLRIHKLDFINNNKEFEYVTEKVVDNHLVALFMDVHNPDSEPIEIKSNYKIGEILYLAEPYFVKKDKVFYKYDSPNLKLKWQNKLFMNEKYARYHIQIKDIFLQRVKSMTEEQCLQEGIEKRLFDEINYVYINPDEPNVCFSIYLKAYADLWDSINNKEKPGKNFPFESNPIVWGYKYELLKESKDFDGLFKDKIDKSFIFDMSKGKLYESIQEKK